MRQAASGKARVDAAAAAAAITAAIAAEIAATIGAAIGAGANAAPAADATFFFWRLNGRSGTEIFFIGGRRPNKRKYWPR
jgi:hypothetical protein